MRQKSFSSPRLFWILGLTVLFQAANAQTVYVTFDALAGSARPGTVISTANSWTPSISGYIFRTDNNLSISTSGPGNSTNMLYKNDWNSGAIEMKQQDEKVFYLKSFGASPYSSWDASPNVFVRGYDKNGTLVVNQTQEITTYTRINITNSTAKLVRVEFGSVNYGASGFPLLDSLAVELFVPGPDTEKPTAPTNLSAANVSSAAFDLSWTASSDDNEVTSYLIYVNGTLDGESTVNSFKVRHTSPSTPYTITIAARDAAGNTSNLSSPLVVTTPATGLTGHTCNFNAGIPGGWNGGYSELSVEGDALKVHPVKVGQWDAFSYTFSTIDVSSMKYISFRMKTNFACNITVAMGNSPSKLDAYPVRINLQGGLCSQEINPSSDFQVYSFDYTGVSDLNFAAVNYIQFLVNPFSSETGGEGSLIWIDDVQIGTHATMVPTVAAVGDFTFTSGTDTVIPKNVILKRIADGTSGLNKIFITAVSSDHNVMDDPVVEHDSVSTTGKLTLSPKTGVAGSVQVAVKLHAPGADDKSLTFNVNVVPNEAPSMDGINEIKARSGSENELDITGINDGNPESSQEIDISVKSPNPAIIPDAFSITYDTRTSFAKVKFTPVAGTLNGTATSLRLRLKDNGGVALAGVDSVVYTIPVRIFDNINHPPTMEAPGNLSNNRGAGLYRLALSGINDNDPGNQTISFVTSSSNASVVSEVYVDSLSGSSAVLHYRLTGTGGASDISIRVKDQSPAATTSGYDSTSYAFTITALPEPAYSWSESFSAGIPDGFYSDPVVFTAGIQEGVLHVTHHVMPFTYPGISIDLKPKNGGRELSIARSPFLSFKIKAKNTNTNKPMRLTFALIDNLPAGVNGNGAYQISMDKSLTFVPCDNNWYSYTIDYRGAFNELNGFHVDSTRINSLLINIDCTWFQEHSGEFWIDDIKIGDGIDNNPLDIVTFSADPIPNQMVQLGSQPGMVRITGISDGRGGNHADMYAFTDNSQLVSNIKIDKPVNGSTCLTYSVSSRNDTANVFVVLHDGWLNNEIKDTLVFKVSVCNPAATSGRVNVTLDLTKEYQTVTGFGAFVPESYSGEMIDLLNDLNYTVMRMGDAFGSGEPENDNDDPDVLELNNFAGESFRLDAIRELVQKTGCQKYYFTVFSPPAWMKYNKSASVHIDAQTWADNNKLDHALYSEYAEYLVGVIRLFREQTGVDLYAISLQNEPEFNEPYASCKISGEEFREIIKIVGRRFEEENITTRIMMPEDICTVTSWVEGKINPVKNDPDAAKYFDIMAIHNYDPDGIQVSGTGSANWNAMRTIFEGTSASELWMSETSGYVNEWWGKYEKDYMHGQWIFKPGAFEIAGVIHNAFRYGHVNAWSGFGDQLENEMKRPNIIGVVRQFSAFIVPGSVMTDIQSDNSDVLTLAFKNPADASLTVILLNRSKSARTVALQGTGIPSAFRIFTTQDNDPVADRGVISGNKVTLPPSSVTTLLSGSSNAPPTIDNVRNVEMLLSLPDSVITLDGITDGEATPSQNLTIAVTVSDESVVTGTLSPINNGESFLTLVPQKLGTASVKIKVSDDGGTANHGSDSREIEFSVSVVNALGTEKVTVSKAYIAPNPVNDKVLVYLNGEPVTACMIFDSQGRVLLQDKPGEAAVLEYNISSLPAGLYIIVLQDKNNRRSMMKFMKK